MKYPQLKRGLSKNNEKKHFKPSNACVQETPKTSCSHAVFAVWCEIFAYAHFNLLLSLERWRGIYSRPNAYFIMFKTHKSNFIRQPYSIPPQSALKNLRLWTDVSLTHHFANFLALSPWPTSQISIEVTSTDIYFSSPPPAPFFLDHLTNLSQWDQEENKDLNVI